MRLLSIGLSNYAVSGYGILRVIALLAGLTVAVHLAHRHGLNRYEALKLGILVLFVALLGTKTYLLARDYIETGAISPSSLLHHGGGFYYGLIPAIAFAWWHLKRNHLPTLSVLDAFSPSVALGLAIARIGCYMAGCCYGKPIETPAIANLAAGSAQLSSAPLNVPLHPTQLYESAAAFVIFLFLIHQFRRNRTEGRVFCLMLILLAAARFVVELFRGDHVRGFIIGGYLSVPQLISALILTAGVALLLWINRSSSQKLFDK